MTLDIVMNLFLICYFAGAIEILAVGNLGYMLAHLFGASAFILLRRDRPNWPRPIRLPDFWVPLAGVLAAINLTFLVVGGFIYSGGFLGIERYGYGWDKTRTGLLVLLVALVLYMLRSRGAGQDPAQAARADQADTGGGARPRGAQGGANRGIVVAR